MLQNKLSIDDAIKEWTEKKETANKKNRTDVDQVQVIQVVSFVITIGRASKADPQSKN
jgi:hypothetical protein